MFDKLDDMLVRYEELMRMLGEPEAASDTKRFTKLMKEQAELAPIVEAYREYKKAKQSSGKPKRPKTGPCRPWRPSGRNSAG